MIVKHDDDIAANSVNDMRFKHPHERKLRREAIRQSTNLTRCDESPVRGTTLENAGRIVSHVTLKGDI